MYKRSMRTSLSSKNKHTMPLHPLVAFHCDTPRYIDKTSNHHLFGDREGEKEEERMEITQSRIDASLLAPYSTSRPGIAPHPTVLTWKQLFTCYVDSEDYKQAVRMFGPEYARNRSAVHDLAMANMRRSTVVLYFMEYKPYELQTRLAYCISLARTDSFVVIESDNDFRNFKFHTHLILLIKITDYVKEDIVEEEEEGGDGVEEDAVETPALKPVFNISEYMLYTFLQKAIKKQVPFVIKNRYISKDKDGGVAKVMIEEDETLITSPHIYILCDEGVDLCELTYRSNEFFERNPLYKNASYKPFSPLVDINKFDFIVSNTVARV